MSEKVLKQATFNPKVKTYWFITSFIVSVFTLVGWIVFILLAPLFFIISTKVLNAMSATLTERKLVVKRGVWFKEEKTIPLEKITDVSMSQGPLMKAFDLTRLSFETAGQSGTGALVSMIGVNDAADFREAILAQKDVNTLKQSNATPSAEATPTDLSTLTQSVLRIETLLEQLLKDKQN